MKINKVCSVCSRSKGVTFYKFANKTYCQDCHPAHKPCIKCGKYFYATSHNAKFCQDPCINLRDPLVFTKTCQWCDKQFQTTKTNQNFCSNDCHKIYVANKYIQTSKRTVNRFVILKRDSFRCIYCGKSSIEDASELHVDHIIPLSENGSDLAGNLVTSCSACNIEKGKTPLDFLVVSRVLKTVKQRNIAHNIDENTNLDLSYGRK